MAPIEFVILVIICFIMNVIANGCKHAPFVEIKIQCGLIPYYIEICYII